MPINTGNIAKLLWPGLNTIYGYNYAEYPLERSQIFETKTSKKAFEENIGMTGYGLAKVKAEGAPINYDTQQQGFLTRFNHVVYATGFVISEEAIEDNLYKEVGLEGTEGIAYSIRQTDETVHANILNRAFNTSYTGGDGSTLIASGGAGSATHANVSGGTWTNGPTTDADLSQAALEQAVIDIAKFTDDRGKKIRVMPKCLIVPVDLQFEAEKILESVLQSDTADNAVNVLKTMGSIPKVVVNHYLTDTDAWFVQTDCKKGLCTYMRRPTSFAIDNDFDTSNMKFKASLRFSAGWIDPRGLYGSEGA